MRTTDNIRPLGEKAEQTNEHRCFYRTSECHKENEQTGIICIRGTRQTHLGVNPYSADGTDLEIVTWQATKKKRQPARERQKERERDWRCVSGSLKKHTHTQKKTKT